AAASSGSRATRSRTSSEAPWCEMPTSESSANGNLFALLTLGLGLAPFADAPGQLVQLPLEPTQLERDDQHVDEHDEEGDSIGGGHLPPGGSHPEDHASTSLSSPSP